MPLTSLANQSAWRSIERAGLRWQAAALLWMVSFVAAACAQDSSPVQLVTLNVRTYDEEREYPLAHVKVELMSFPDGVLTLAFTDSTGRLAFRQILPNAYVIRASRDEYRTVEVRVDIRRGDSSPEVSVPMRRILAEQNIPAGGVLSARMLSIPAPAFKQFQKGIELLNEKKSPQRSVEYFEKAIAVAPDYYEAYFMMGMAHLQLKSPNEAQAALSKAIELNEQYLEPYYPLSVLLIAEKEYEKAEGLLRRAMELDPKGWRWPFELARCFAAKRQWENALVYGKMAHDRPNAPTKVHLLMADLYSTTGQAAEAVKELEKFMILDPKSPYIPRAKTALEQLRTQKPN